MKGLSKLCVLHELFEAQVEQVPESIALIYGEKQLTYGELNQQANRVAHYLRKLHVGPETLVGLCVPRSLEMVIGLLGILKAGGAYLPLDPAYPHDRLAFLLQDTQAPVLLTQHALSARLPVEDARILCLDSEWASLQRENSDNLTRKVEARNLAYVIYTSGSTGRPKGVLVSHEGLYNLAEVQARLFDIKPGDRVLQVASLNFDASISEIAMTLSAGAALVLTDQETVSSGTMLVRLFQEQKITVVTLVPSVLASLFAPEFPTLRTIIAAGEACPAELAARWATGRRFFNAYGPTEATVCATVAAYCHGSRSLSIGYPITNTQLYILDEQFQPVPEGVPGEIYLGGVSLARGYFNRPDLTAECFIAHPFSSEQGERLYRTGDRARYLPDGTIGFLGRLDQQVKLRGFRIELGEIEATLVGHPAVREAVVVVHDHSSGDKRLVAYVLADQEQPVTIVELRRFLKGMLPDYMVPSLFMLMEKLPLTPSGKVDRCALPLPESFQQELETTYVAPRSELEHLIARVLQELLQVEQIGIDDNFFELGGHSLLAVKVHSNLQEMLHTNFSVVDVFEYPTINSLADYISRELSE